MIQSPSPDTALSPTWRPPKAPLPPHRLAKLANALGVSTPIPANGSSLSRSFSDSSGPMDQIRRSPTPFRRSPTPSTATSSVGFNPYSPSTSKFMLHVIPPLHLPHESDSLDDDSDMTPPPANASGYHTQFRRGTLVPLHSTFQAQLGAIAKEYALPSTVGLILYLVTTTQLQPTSPGVLPAEEPGPRLSEDIWKHIWTRVLQVEQREETLMPSPNPTPRLLGLGIGARSTPYLPQESHLRPFLSSPGGMEPAQPQPTYPFTPSPSTPSSASDIRSSSKSAPPSSISDEPGTPDTSVGGSVRADSFDLPGLHSPSLIPILAKIEFDIDRRRAGWYEPWIRSRKANHAKRAGSRASRKGSKSQDEDENQGRMPQIRLLIGRKQTASPVSLNASLADDTAEEEVGGDADHENDMSEGEYEPLPESEGAESDQEDEEEDVAEDATARVSSLIRGKDPLEDVFGSDPDTWADIHSESNHNTHDIDPNITNLALTGADLSAISDLEDDRIAGREEDEVEALLEQMSRPHLAISIPGSSPPLSQKRSSSPSTQTRRHVPPPLVLIPQNQPANGPIPLEPNPLDESSANLAYLESSSPEFSDHDLEEFDEYTRVRSPSESDKRGGAVFGDLDLGLDPTEDFDDNDPHDRRRSQYLMRAQLDEIERTLAQLSPRILKADLDEEHNQSFHSATLSPNAPSLTLSPGGNTQNSDFFPLSSRLPKHPDPPSPPDPYNNASWPAVPFSSFKDKPEAGSALKNGPPSPPRLAVNGVTTSAPRSFVSRVPSDQPSAESNLRRQELEEEESLYPPASARSLDSSSSSPVIPMSPDPFGRYPSTPDIPAGSRLSTNQWEIVNMGREPVPLSTVMEGVEPPAQEAQGRARSGTTSRFSADSFTEETSSGAKSSNRATLMSVRSIKKLWRKSSNKDNKAPPPVPVSSAPSSRRASPQPLPQRPERPSEEHQDFPDVPDLPPTPLFGRFSPQQPPSHHTRPSQDHLYMQSRSSLDLPLPSRMSQDQLAPPPPPSQQLSVPFQNRNLNGNNAAHIIPTQMLPSRSGSNLDRLHFDQESPYPIRPIRHSPRPASPPPLPPIPDKDRVVRKSILKSWKSSSSGNAAPLPVAEPRSSIEHQNGPPRGGRRPSAVATTRSSITSPDLPPSPQIPEHFLNGKNGPPPPDHRQSTRSRLTTSSTDSSRSPPERQHSLGARSSSPSRSMSSSRSSQETRPSFDVSQFELVSPKMNSTLSYPYHALDHESDGHRN